MRSSKPDVDILISTRVSGSQYDKILKRQRKLKELTGIEPSVSAVLRVMIEEATANDEKKKKRAA